MGGANSLSSVNQSETELTYVEVGFLSVMQLEQHVEQKCPFAFTCLGGSTC